MSSTHVFPAIAELSIIEHKMLRQRLKVDYPGLDDQTLEDTLEGLSNVREILTEVIRSVLEDETLVSGLSTRIAEMKARQKRLSKRVDAKRALALRAMVEAEIKSLTEPDFSAFIRRGLPVLEVLSEEAIPPEYWNPQPPKLDRHKLLEALKGGVEVVGAAMSDSVVQLSVRTR